MATRSNAVCGHCGATGHAKNYCVRPAVGQHAQFPQRYRANCAACRGAPFLARGFGGAPAPAPAAAVPAPVPARAPGGAVHASQYHEFSFFQTLTLRNGAVNTLHFDRASVPRVDALLGWHRLVTLSSAVAHPLLEGGTNGQVWLVFDHDAAAHSSLANFSDHGHSAFFTSANGGSFALDLQPDGMQIASRRFHDRPTGVPAVTLFGYSTFAADIAVRVQIVVRAAQRFRDAPPTNAPTLTVASLPASPAANAFSETPIAGLYRLRLDAGRYWRFNNAGSNLLEVSAGSANSGFSPIPCPGISTGVARSRVTGLHGGFNSAMGAWQVGTGGLDLFVIIV